MEKLEIYNKALDLCGQEPLTALNEDAELKSSAEKTLDLWYMPSLRKVSLAMAWPFLEVALQLGDDEGAGLGYRHRYPCPADLEQLTWAEGDRYLRIGNVLCTDGKKEAYGILRDIVPDSNVPESFYDLVAIALASHASVRLSPDQNTRTQIGYLYKTSLDEMIGYWLQNELMGTRYGN